MKKLLMVMVLGASAVAASAQGLRPQRTLGSRSARPTQIASQTADAAKDREARKARAAQRSQFSAGSSTAEFDRECETLFMDIVREAEICQTNLAIYATYPYWPDAMGVVSNFCEKENCVVVDVGHHFGKWKQGSWWQGSGKKAYVVRSNLKAERWFVSQRWEKDGFCVISRGRSYTNFVYSGVGSVCCYDSDGRFVEMYDSLDKIPAMKQCFDDELKLNYGEQDRWMKAHGFAEEGSGREAENRLDAARTNVIDRLKSLRTILSFFPQWRSDNQWYGVCDVGAGMGGPSRYGEPIGVRPLLGGLRRPGSKPSVNINTNDEVLARVNERFECLGRKQDKLIETVVRDLTGLEFGVPANTNGVLDLKFNLGSYETCAFGTNQGVVNSVTLIAEFEPSCEQKTIHEKLDQSLSTLLSAIGMDRDALTYNESPSGARPLLGRPRRQGGDQDWKSVQSFSQRFTISRDKKPSGEYGVTISDQRKVEVPAVNDNARQTGLLGGSLRARRLQRQQQAEADAAKQQAEQAAREAERQAQAEQEKAQREAERAEQRQQLLAIQEELKRVREARAAASEAQVKGAVAKGDFKAKLTGIAIIEGGRMCGYEERANNAEFLSPDTSMEIPYGKAACFRVEYDFPEGYQGRVWISDRWQKGEDGSGYYFGSNPSPLYKGKGIAFGFLDMLERGKTCTLKRLAIRTNAEPKLEEPSKEWDIVVTPVDIKFHGPETAQKAQSKDDEKVISNNPPQGVNSVADKLQGCDFLLNKDFKKNAKFYLCLFSASWCGPCRREMPRIAKTYAETLKGDPDIELVHFSCDQNDEKALAWAKEHDVKFPVVKPNGGNPLDLHSRGIPHLFIVKADGTLLEEGHPMKLFTDEKLREIKGGGSEVGVKLDDGDVDSRSVKKLGACRNRVQNGSTSRLDFETREEIGRLLRSAQPRKKIVVPQRDLSTELPVFTNPEEAQRKAKELGLWMFVYNMLCTRGGEFDESSLFLNYLSKHCVFVVPKCSTSKSTACPWTDSDCLPCCRILDSDGHLVSSVATWSGVANCNVSGERMKEIFKGFMTACEIMPAAFDAVERSPNDAGLSKLHDTLSSLPESFVNIAYQEWAEMLVNVDRTGHRGWRACYSYVDKVRPLTKEFWKSYYRSDRYDKNYTQIKMDKVKHHDFLSKIDRVLLERQISTTDDFLTRINAVGEQTLSDEARFRLKHFRESVENSRNRLVEIKSNLLAFEKLLEQNGNGSSVDAKSSIVDGDYTETVDGYTWSYSVKNGEVMIGRKHGCAISPRPKGRISIPSVLGGVIVTKIDGFAFVDCGDITSVSIPSNVTAISNRAFARCKNLVSFSVDSGNPSYSARDGLLCSKDGAILIAGVNRDVVIPSSVTHIGDCAFFQCEGFLTSAIFVSSMSAELNTLNSGRTMNVTIPASVKRIGDRAFSDCSGLTSVTMCGELPVAGWKVFDRCENLKAIHVPANAKSWAGMKEWQGIPLVFDAEAGE